MKTPAQYQGASNLEAQEKSWQLSPQIGAFWRVSFLFAGLVLCFGRGQGEGRVSFLGVLREGISLVVWFFTVWQNQT